MGGPCTSKSLAGRYGVATVIIMPSASNWLRSHGISRSRYRRPLFTSCPLRRRGCDGSLRHSPINGMRRVHPDKLRAPFAEFLDFPCAPFLPPPAPETPAFASSRFQYHPVFPADPRRSEYGIRLSPSASAVTRFQLRASFYLRPLAPVAP